MATSLLLLLLLPVGVFTLSRLRPSVIGGVKKIQSRSSSNL
jgi:hypothetical protein